MVVDPILPYKLHDSFGYDEREVGFFFVYFTLSSLLVLFCMLFVPGKWDKSYFMVSGSLGLIFGYFLIGPSNLSHLPNSEGLMEVGMVIGGIARALLFSFAMNEAIKGGNEAFPEHENQVR